MQHLLYFSGYRMVVFRWEAGGFTGIAEFDPDEKGYKAFRRLLLSEVKKPLRLLVDIIEEDFRSERVPHLYGKDREAVRQRALQKHFRQSAHTHVITQGRQADGRRDDTVLLSALTNAKLFKPWLDILSEGKMPLQGIYSLPLVGEKLLKPLNAQKGGVLIISQQVPSNIRQSFYLDGHLKLSRLAPSRDDTASHYEVLSEETDRTIKFLQNQHFIGRAGRLDIYVIAYGGEHPALADVFKDDDTRHYHLIDKDTLAAEIGVRSVTPSRYCNWIYAHLLLQDRKIRPHYGTLAEKKYYLHYVANRVMSAAAVLMFVGALLLSGSSFFNASLHSSQMRNLQKDTVRYTQLYKGMIKEIAELSLDVNDVKAAVETAQEIQTKYAHTPENLLRSVSGVLGQHGDIQLEALKWAATYDPAHSLGEKKALNMDPTSIRMRASRRSRADTFYEKLLIEATVKDFNNNPRVAIEKVNAFVRTLQNDQIVGKVELLKVPYDIASDRHFSGQGVSSSGTAADAKFSVILLNESPVTP